MHARSILTTGVAAAALTLIAPAAHAATLERFDRSAYDGAPVVTAAGYAMSAATSGELGGHLSLSIQAADGTLPARGQCETADVHAVLAVAQTETFTIDTTGELCSHIVDGSPSLNASFGARDVSYTGTHKRARVSEGSVAFADTFGAQGAVGLTVRW